MTAYVCNQYSDLCFNSPLPVELPLSLSSLFLSLPTPKLHSHPLLSPTFKPNPLSTLLFTSYSLPFLPNHLSPLYLSTLPFSGAERSSAQVLEWEAWRSTHSCRHSQQSRACLPCLVLNHGPGSVSARTRPLIQHRGEGKGGEGDRSRPGCYLCAPSSRSLSEPHLLLLLLLLLSFSPSSPWLILPFLSNAFYHTSRPSFFPSLFLSFSIILHCVYMTLLRFENKNWPIHHTTHHTIPHYTTLHCLESVVSGASIARLSSNATARKDLNYWRSIKSCSFFWPPHQPFFSTRNKT